MKTIFAYFDSYLDADEAVDALLGQGFREESMNVVALEKVVKENIGVNLREVNVQKSDEVGEQTVQGLAQLFGGEQAVHVAQTGDVLAGGELATMLVTQAAATGADGGALRRVLEEYGVPKDVAADFQSGINQGGVLLWIRSDDERAPVASNALRAQNGMNVGEYS